MRRGPSYKYSRAGEKSWVRHTLWSSLVTVLDGNDIDKEGEWRDSSGKLLSDGFTSWKSGLGRNK